MSATRPPSIAVRLAGPAPERLPRHPHGLSREDVARSQRGRILRAVAESVAAKGYSATSVADVIAPFQHIGILSLEFHVDKLSRPLL